MTFDPILDVSPHVSPTLHPKALSRFADVLDADDTPGQPFYRLLQGNLVDTATVFHALGTALEDLGELENENGKHRRGAGEFFGDIRMLNGKIKVYSTIYDEYADTSDELVKDVQAKLDRVRKNYEGTKSMLESRVRQEIHREAKPHADQAELRAFVKANFDNPMSRLNFVRKQMKDNGDRQLVQAVLAKPFYLSGLDEQASALLQKEAAIQYAYVYERQRTVVADEISGVLNAWQQQITKRNEVAANIRTNAKAQAKKTINELRKLSPVKG